MSREPIPMNQTGLISSASQPRYPSNAETAYYEDNYGRFLPKDTNAAILDIGCGPGDFVRFLHKRGYRNITAVDVDEAAIASLQGIDGLTAIQCQIDGPALQRMDAKWDLILAKQMIIYLDRHQAPEFVRAIANSLADDGRVIVDVFNGALLSSRFTELKDPGIQTAYTDLGLQRLLEWNGLEVEDLFGARIGGKSVRAQFYRAAQLVWFRLYRCLLVLERGYDNELPRIGQKILIAVARRARR